MCINFPNLMKQYLVLIFLMACSLQHSVAQEQSSTWLWQISKGDLVGKSYLFGTMPLQDSIVFNFPEKVWKYLDRSDVVVRLKEEDINLRQKFLDAYYGDFQKHFATTPEQYIVSIAEREMKPIVDLNPDFSISNHYNSSTAPNNSNRALSHNVVEEYLSAYVDEFLVTRQSLDVPESTYQTISSKTNYLLLNELIRYMQLQPVFVPIDAIYLGGNTGLVQLFRERGYSVKALEEKDYKEVAEQIEYQKMMRAQWESQQAQNQPVPQTDTNQAVDNQPQVIHVADTQPTGSVKLNLPPEIINLTEWGAYSLKDSIITYRAPMRLKVDDRNNNLYIAQYGDMEYSLEFVPKWKNKKNAIEQIVIRNGGQLVNEQNFQNSSLFGEEIELMYAENQISKHVLIEGVVDNTIATVKGPTPAIYSLVADDFFQSLVMKNVLPPNQSLPSDLVAPTPLPEVVSWNILQKQRLSITFPSNAESNAATLSNGSQITTYTSNKSVDENTYLLAISKRQTFDNFKLFNDAINTIASELRGVIDKRNVMPGGNQSIAEYEIKDAVGNYYRVKLIFDGAYFYQLYAKGDDKSINNETANTIFNSTIIQ